MTSILSMRDADVLKLLPDDVATRLETLLFDPLADMVDATKNAVGAVVGQVASRDQAALQTRIGTLTQLAG